MSKICIKIVYCDFSFAFLLVLNCAKALNFNIALYDDNFYYVNILDVKNRNQ